MKVNFVSGPKLSESFRNGVRFAFCHKPTKDAVKPLHQLVYCKDFLSDVVWSEVMKQPIEIYNFQWKPGTLDVSEPVHYLLVNDKESLGKYQENLQTFINEVEELLGYQSSSVTKADGSLLVEFSNKWLTSPRLVSLFSLLLRCGVDYDGAGGALEHLKKIKSNGHPFGPNDTSILASSWERVETLFAKGKIELNQYQSYPSVGRVHGYGGIMGKQ